MKHQDYSTYYQMSLNGEVTPWLCIDESHLTNMVPIYEDDSDDTIIICIFPGCDYKIRPGIDFNQKMVADMKRVLSE
jgi:hypothetical protein